MTFIRIPCDLLGLAYVLSPPKFHVYSVIIVHHQLNKT